MRHSFWWSWEFVERLLRVIQTVGVAVAGFSLLLASHQLKLARLSESATLGLQFDTRINTGVNFEISGAIEDDAKLLKKHDGKFTEAQLDDYLGQYDALYYLYAQGLVNEQMIFALFSYDIGLAYKNHEVQEYVREVQAKDASLFVGFNKLAQTIETWKSAGRVKRLIEGFVD